MLNKCDTASNPFALSDGQFLLIKLLHTVMFGDISGPLSTKILLAVGY